MDIQFDTKIVTRVSKVQKNTLDAHCKKKNISISEYIRSLIDAANPPKKAKK